MSIDLTIFERGEPFVGDLARKLTEQQSRVSAMQLKQIVHRRRVIIIVEGSEGGGKSDFLRLLGAAFDPLHVAFTASWPDRRRAGEGHWLAPYWSHLPQAGHGAVFHHSWYRRVLEDKVQGLVSEAESKRAFDEINEFEAQQRDFGTLLIKLFFHLTDATQARRVAEREADEWRRHLLGPADLRTSQARSAYRDAVVDMLAQTDTRWAPWSMIDANDRGSSMVAALRAVAEALDKGLPQTPPDLAGEDAPFMASSEAIQSVG